MLLIKDNTELRSYIPNSFGIVMGGVSLFDKMKPFLLTAQKWLTDNILPEEMLSEAESDGLNAEEPMYFLPRRIVTLRAWQLALPALDVLVTNNGVGAAETDTIKPASKAKIDRLLLTTADELDLAIAMLVNHLKKSDRWWASEQADPFRQTILNNYAALPSIPGADKRICETETIHDRFLRAIPQIFPIEKEIATDAVSTPVYRRLLHLAQKPKADPQKDPKDAHAIRLLTLARSAVIQLIDCPGKKQNTRILAELSAFILANRPFFPEWEGSLTQRIFDSSHFKNSPDATAHWL